VSNTPASNARPVGVTLAGSTLGKNEAPVRGHREEGLPWLLLLLPVGSLAFAALLIIALSWISGAPSPALDRATSGEDVEMRMESPVIEETEGDETTTRHEMRTPGRPN